MGPDNDRDRHQHEDNEIGRAVNDLTPSITVIHGYAQLLQRRIRARGMPAEDDLLKALARIERAARAMDERLRRLEDERTSRDS